ncbi:nucleic-acid-binding protein from transposon X-element [Caerostris extrusa]|uniref:Nucleic-acid-binding protein from transposon X-element n=1 Tax=Caerostris extrusa TaxID=172846 RepID=A0AAV4S2E0_CAEEX|nr:nucleic-acid-binding protein from transposon X-element [Caerostris extrusa]
MEAIKTSGFNIIKFIQLSKFNTKPPMPLYVQVANCLNIEVDRNVRYPRFNLKVQEEDSPHPTQCFRCQCFWHSSKAFHLLQKCVKYTGNHAAKDCNPDLEQCILKCANCSEKHAANWRHCPHFPKRK